MPEVTEKLDPGWTKPENATVALERGLDIARDEQKWTRGAWFTLDRIKTRAKVTPWGEVDCDKLVCTDVTACAGGILVIVCLNGPTLRAYFKGEVAPGVALASDEVGSAAAGLLRRGLVEVFGHYAEGRAVDQIVTINDLDYDHGDRAAHHSKIVRGFERAVELSKEA